MNINSIYITIILIFVLILLLIYYCYYNSKNNIEKYTNLDCNNYKDGSYCKQIGEENPFWCFIKKLFCFIIYLKNQIISKDEVIKTKDTVIVNLEDEVVILDKNIIELNNSIKTIETAIKNSNSENTVSSEALIESERKRLELSEEKTKLELKKKELLAEINNLEYSESELKNTNETSKIEIMKSYEDISDLSRYIRTYKENEEMYKKNEQDIYDICNIKIENIEDEAIKKQLILDQIKIKCSSSGEPQTPENSNTGTETNTGTSSGTDSGSGTSSGTDSGGGGRWMVDTPVAGDDTTGYCDDGWYKGSNNLCAKIEDIPCPKNKFISNIEKLLETERCTQCMPGHCQNDNDATECTAFDNDNPPHDACKLNTLYIPELNTFDNRLLPTNEKVETDKERCIKICIESKCTNNSESDECLNADTYCRSYDSNCNNHNNYALF